MISPLTEKKLLQVIVALACVVPVSAGLIGTIKGVHVVGGTIDLDSHFRYLSGLLLGIGLAFLSLIPHIETRAGYFRILTVIVVIGGISRLRGFFLIGIPDPAMQFALVMELLVTPLICLWQQRVAHQFNK